MGRKIVRILSLIGMICFLLMGKTYSYASNVQKGVSYSSGIMVDGKYKVIDSGTLGGNSQRAEKFNSGATTFYWLGGFCGVICVGTFLGRKKNKNVR